MTIMARTFTQLFHNPRRNAGLMVLFPEAGREARRDVMEYVNSPPDSQEDFAALLLAVGTKSDVKAFEALFRHFGPRIRAYMMKLCRDRSVAEELMQETMVNIWRKADQYDPSRGPAAGWIFTIARNVRVDNFRKMKRPEFDPNDPAFVPEPLPEADYLVEAQEDSERLRVAMNTLPPEQLELLRYSFFEEASHSVIAKKLNLPIGTVKSRIRLAFSRLRDELGDRS
jgi:RNA polymerase sigma factor (sigma-70 family)